MNLPRLLSGPRRGLMVRLLINGAAQAASAFVIAWLLREALSGMRAGTGAPPWEIVGGLVLAALAILGLRVRERIDAERLGQDYVMKTRLRLFERLAAAPARTERPARFGLTMTRMVSDLNGLKNWVSMGVARMAVSSVSITGSLGALAYFNTPAAAIATGVVLLGVGTAALITPALRVRVREARHRRGLLAGNLGEKVFAVQTIRHFGQAPREMRRLHGQSRKLAQANVRRMELSALLRALPDAAVPIAVAFLVGAAVLNIGGVSADGGLVVTLLLLGMIAASMRDVARAWDFRLTFEEARRRVGSILSQQRVTDAGDAVDLVGEDAVAIAYDSVCVSGVLDDVSAAAKARERVLLTGPSGSGKSTLLGLAARLFDPRQGRVLLDGHDLRGLSTAAVHGAVQLVAPELSLLRGTVAKNIAYGMTEDDPELVEHAAALCGLIEPNVALPEGLETRIQETGRNLSQGLRARIALARALAAGPRLLLIDDPAFTVDPDARAALRRALAVTAATVLMTGTGEDAFFAPDRVWHLEGGRLTDLPGPKPEPRSEQGMFTAISA